MVTQDIGEDCEEYREDHREILGTKLNDISNSLYKLNYKDQHMLKNVIGCNETTNIQEQAKGRCIFFADVPCTFELDFCGWQTFNNMTINGLQVTRTWRIVRQTWPDAPNDYSYFHSNGTFFYSVMICQLNI